MYKNLFLPKAYTIFAAQMQKLWKDLAACNHEKKC